MPYYLDLASLNLGFLKKRLVEEDLIPSLLPLREGMDEKLKRVGAAGLRTLADLKTALAKEKPLNAMAKTTGIDVGYLKLLGRALRGYTPRPAALEDYPGIEKKTVAPLRRADIRDSRALWENALRPGDRTRLMKTTGVAVRDLLELLCLCDLSRIQWVSPLFGRLRMAQERGRRFRVPPFLEE